MRVAKPNQGGFTLIEVILVMAISTLLLLIAFSGWRQLQARARFDAAINKVIQDISYARNYAMSNVYEAGDGVSRTSEFAGVGFEADNDHANGQLFEMEPIYSNYDASGALLGHAHLPAGGSCPNERDAECFEQFFGSPDVLTLANASEAEIIYLNTGNGLKVCGFNTGGFTGVDKMCSPSNPDYGKPLDLKLRNPEGMTATIRIDPSTGNAKRID